MQGLETSALAIINTFIPYTYILVAVALIANGIACAVGGQEGREKAKKALPWVGIGAGLIIGAVQIAHAVVSKMTF